MYAVAVHLAASTAKASGNPAMIAGGVSCFWTVLTISSVSHDDPRSTEEGIEMGYRFNFGDVLTPEQAAQPVRQLQGVAGGRDWIGNYTEQLTNRPSSEARSFSV